MKIFVSNIKFRVPEKDLQDLFKQYGTVDDCKIIIDKQTGRSKGFAFVEMPDDEEARKAIEQLNGFELEGRKLAVNESQPRRH